MFYIVWLVVTGTMEWILTFPSYWEWNVIIPTDFHSMMFQDGKNQQPVMIHGLQFIPLLLQLLWLQTGYPQYFDGKLVHRKTRPWVFSPGSSFSHDHVDHILLQRFHDYQWE
jgi:hypothetical protein